jgi:hypothetical protein
MAFARGLPFVEPDQFHPGEVLECVQDPRSADRTRAGAHFGPPAGALPKVLAASDTPMPP